jgi:hypothetical protein
MFRLDKGFCRELMSDADKVKPRLPPDRNIRDSNDLVEFLAFGVFLEALSSVTTNIKTFPGTMQMCQ